MKRFILCIVAIACLGQSTPGFAQQNPAPNLASTYQAALVHHHLGGDQDRWTSRARWSGLLPRVELRGRWTNDQQIGWLYREDQAFTSGAPTHQGRSDADLERQDATLLEVRVRFELGHLLFHKQELGIQRALLATDQKRWLLLKHVKGAYFHREKHLLQAELSRRIDGPDSTEALTHDLQATLYTEELDLLTGGWFSRQ